MASATIKLLVCFWHLIRWRILWFLRSERIEQAIQKTEFKCLMWKEIQKILQSNSETGAKYIMHHTIKHTGPRTSEQ